MQKLKKEIAIVENHFKDDYLYFYCLNFLNSKPITILPLDKRSTVSFEIVLFIGYENFSMDFMLYITVDDK